MSNRLFAEAGNNSGKQQRCDPATTTAPLRNADQEREGAPREATGKKIYKKSINNALPL
ncbi:MAG: hypothetical protein F6K48_30355 [Okeania sp. SIO3H1]|uniref:hypothetical protein n=1 Tax=Okeania sp. SIO1I7 TaxID=2607772 RepID=UPI0013C8D68B|nr:hypothetical protein [Okeania sp. SIO1I7]NEN92962.1 hypothetical protein [Okeania sp. SIO3H1]NET27439.1 hypothetical protein [Okeania sp. SIO1I7]